MPNYDYECSKCHNIFEVTHPMVGSKKKIKCRRCGSTKVNKVFYPSYVKFIGDGWQTNDVRGIK